MKLLSPTLRLYPHFNSIGRELAADWPVAALRGAAYGHLGPLFTEIDGKIPSVVPRMNSWMAVSTLALIQDFTRDLRGGTPVRPRLKAVL